MGTTAWWSGRHNRGGWRLTGHRGLPTQAAVDRLFRRADRPLVLAYVDDDDLAWAAGTDARGRVVWAAGLGWRAGGEDDPGLVPSPPTDVKTIAEWAGVYADRVSVADIHRILDAEWGAGAASEGLHELFVALGVPLPRIEETLRQAEWDAGSQRESVYGTRLVSREARSVFVEASPWQSRMYRLDAAGQIVGRSYAPGPSSRELLAGDWVEVPATVPRTIAATLRWAQAELAEPRDDRDDG